MHLGYHIITSDDRGKIITPTGSSSERALDPQTLLLSKQRYFLRALDDDPYSANNYWDDRSSVLARPIRLRRRPPKRGQDTVSHRRPFDWNRPPLPACDEVIISVDGAIPSPRLAPATNYLGTIVIRPLRSSSSYDQTTSPSTPLAQVSHTEHSQATSTRRRSAELCCVYMRRSSGPEPASAFTDL